MFQIRDHHMEALEAAAVENFEKRAIVHLRANLPRQTDLLTDDDLRVRIRFARQRGRYYGLTSERQIIRFVDATFLMSSSFDTDAQWSWTRDILLDPELSADERSALLVTAAEAFYA